MADNTVLNLGSGGDTVRDVSKGGIKTPVCLIDVGGSGSEVLVSAANPMPVTVAPLGQALAAASVPVVLTAIQVAALTPPAALTGFALDTTLSTLSGKIPALGQALAAASLPVILPSATVTTLTPPAAITGFALDATLSTLSGKVPALGQALAAASTPVVLTAAQLATLTPPSTLTAVTTVTTVSAVTAISNALPAGTNLLGQVANGQQVGTAYSGTTALTPKYAKIDTASSGDTTLVALVSGKQITVLKWLAMASGGANNIKFMDGAGTSVTGLMNLLANQPVSGAYCPVGHFQTAASQLLKINLSAATQVSGYIVYLEV